MCNVLIAFLFHEVLLRYVCSCQVQPWVNVKRVLGGMFVHITAYFAMHDSINVFQY